MFLWNSLKRRFSSTPNPLAKLKSLCSNDLHSLPQPKLKQFLSEIKTLDIDKPLTQFLSELQTSNRGEPSNNARKLKLIIILFYAQNQPKIQQWLFNHKLTVSLRKQSLMQSAMLTTLLEEYLGEISSRMYYYLLRKVRSGGEVGGGTEETVRMSVNRLYKIVNDLDFLFEMRDLFHRMFSRYSDISLIQQVFQLVLEQSNTLYNKFKQLFTMYLQTCTTSEQNTKQISEVIDINKRTYKKLRQLYFVSDLLAGQGTVLKKYNLSKMAEIPAEYARKMMRQKRVNRYSGELTKSAVISTSVQKGESKVNLMDSLSERQSADEDGGGGGEEEGMY